MTDEQRATRRQKYREYRERNREYFRKRNLAWQRDNPEKARARSLRWQKKHPDKYRETKARCAKRRYRTDPATATAVKLRNRLRKRAGARPTSLRKDDRPTIRFLRWLRVKVGADAGRGDLWHIDHLIPLSLLDLTTPEGQRYANSPENVRWLTAEDNIGKADQAPTLTDIAAHLKLVAEWRKTL